MSYNRIIFPATKSNKVAIQEARELIDLIYPLQADKTNSTNEKREQLLTKLNSLDSRLLTFKENEELNHLINELKYQYATMHNPTVTVEQRDHMQSTLSNININNGVFKTGDTTHITTQINNILGEKPSPPVDVIAYQEKLRKRYSAEVFSMIKPLFGKPLEMEGQYINLQLIYQVKDKGKKADEASSSKEFKDERISSFEDLFGKKQAVKLDDLFQPADQLFSTEEMPKYEKKGECPWLLLVQGRAGIGKTTMARYLAWAWGQKKLWQNRESQYEWVFYLPLRNLKALKLKEWISQTYFDDGAHSEKDFDEIWRKIIAEKGKTLFILDGYDEIPDDYGDQNENALNYLLNSGNEHHVLITSRPYGIDNLPVKRRNLEVVGFTDENIIHYVENYFKAKKRKEQASNLLNVLRNNISLWSNAHVPVILNIMCGVHEDSEEKNNKDNTQASVLSDMMTMTKLYQKMEVVLADRSYLTQLKLEAEKKKFKKRSKKAQQKEVKDYYHHAFDFLAYLAYESLIAEQGGLILSNKKVEAARDKYGDKLELLGKGKGEDEADHFERAEKLGFLKPILNEGKACDYEFLHLTFQEYFAACYVAKGLMMVDKVADQFKRAKAFIFQEKYNPRYQIVFWFVAGLLRQNDETYTEYIRLLQGQNSKEFLTGDLLQHYGLGLLARCLDEGLATNENILPVLPVIDQSISLLQARVKSLYLCAQRTNRVISSALIESLWLSPRLLLLPGKKDLYNQIDLGDDTSHVEGSMRSIGQIRIATPKVLEYLAKQLANPSQAIRQETANAIRGIKSKAAIPAILTQLANLLSDENDSVRWRAAGAVRGIGPAAATPDFLDKLAKLLSDKKDSVCLIAAEAVRGIGPAAATPDFLEKLAKLLSDENDSVRWRAADAVSGIGPAAATPAMLVQLANLLSDGNDNVRESAAYAVRDIGPEAATPAILGKLVSLLRDKNYRVRWSAAGAARSIGSEAATPAVLAQLDNLLSDENDYARVSAAETICGIGSKAATPEIFAQLTKLLSDKDDDVRKSAAEAVRGIGFKAATMEILAQLAKLLSDEDDDVRYSAANAVRGIGSEAATSEIFEKLVSLLSDEDDDVCCRAANTVHYIGSVAATPAIRAQLAKLLSDKNDRVRKSAADAVGGIGSKAATK